MSMLTNFNFQSHSVRSFTDEAQEAWFSAKDVCSVLGYRNDTDAIKKHCKERGVAKRDTPTTSGIQPLAYINEPNLYRLIVKSRKPEAEKFEAWVMEEVLPTIRKTGGYTLTINPAQQRAIQEFVNIKVRKEGATHQTVYHDLKTRFNVGKYDQLPSSRFDECIKWLEGYAPQIPQRETIDQVIAKLTDQVEKSNSYPVEYFLPLWRAVNQRLGLEDKMMISRQKISDLYNDLGKLRSRVDGFGIMESDLPPSWWQKNRIAV